MRGPILLLLLAGCGGLENAPLRVGTVNGRVSNADPASGSITDTRSGASATLAKDGSFSLAGVPAGGADLFVIASVPSGLAIILHTEVNGGQLTQAGVFDAQLGGFVIVHLRGINDPMGGTVDLDATPFTGEPVDAMGRAQLGPVPPGCYTGHVHHPAHGDGQFDVCVNAGQQQSVDADLQM